MDGLLGLRRPGRRWCACWCATATCSTAWKPAWRASAAWRCAPCMRCGATPAAAPPQHRRALRPRQRFFRLFLSPDLMYSSAMFAGEDDTLEAGLRPQARPHLPQARAAARRSRGRDRHRLGRLRAARGARTTAATSPPPRSRASSTRWPAQRVAAAGLRRPRRPCCWRTTATSRGQYDKLVSIEMIEAIGAPLPRHLLSPSCGALLKPDGLALVQAITIEDHRYEQALRLGRLHPAPHLPRQLHSLGRGDARGQDPRQRPAPGPPRGLRRPTRRRCAPGASASSRGCRQVRALGFDERFMRMWEFYLCYCEGGFRERSIGVAQLLLAKPGNRRAAG